MSLARSVELTVSTAYDYLASRGVPVLRVTELAGGVSNTVLLAETSEDRLVLKQSLPQLRVEQQWLSDLSRIWREADALETLAPLLPRGAVPRVIFRDDENYLFAMTAAPAGTETWKSALFRGDCDLSVAASIGDITAAIVRCSWQSGPMQTAFGELTVFDQLRLDPYYRTVARRHHDLAGFFESLTKGYAARRHALVHGDWSPKNFLIGPGTVMAIDFEAIHYGDPAFDAAFLLNHLLLKSFHMPERGVALAALAERFWTTLRTGMPKIDDFERHTIEHLGALLLSRIDGKSPVEYIRNPDQKQEIRELARRIIVTPPQFVLEVFEQCP